VKCGLRGGDVEDCRATAGERRPALLGRAARVGKLAGRLGPAAGGPGEQPRRRLRLVQINQVDVDPVGDEPGQLAGGNADREQPVGLVGITDQRRGPLVAGVRRGEVRRRQHCQHPVRRLERLVHASDEVLAWAEVPGLQDGAVAGPFKGIGNPLGPGDIDAGVTEEEILGFAVLAIGRHAAHPTPTCPRLVRLRARADRVVLPRRRILRLAVRLVLGALVGKRGGLAGRAPARRSMRRLGGVPVTMAWGYPQPGDERLVRHRAGWHAARAAPARSMVWPTSPGAMACAGVCRAPWTLRRAGPASARQCEVRLGA
jgi:hypothetical protein